MTDREEAGGRAVSDLDALKAEVEALRDEQTRLLARKTGEQLHWYRIGRHDGLTDTLDLIDKHAQEGQ